MPDEYDEIGAPPLLCAHHQAVVHNLEQKDHVGDAESTRAAHQIARQCPQCSRKAAP